MSSQANIFIIDDDADVRDSLRALLESARFQVSDYHSARVFLNEFSPTGNACIIADIRMPDMDGLTLQEELIKRSVNTPVIIVTGHGDVPLAVRAMRAGVADFIEKPYDDELLLESVRRALDLSKQQSQGKTEIQAHAERIENLTPRERDVLHSLIAGSSNKVIAYELGISPRTVEIHRARLMEKMQVRSLAELVRIALSAGLRPASKT